eukprot:1144650-Pelagomonas_calceolata.AAC.1
MLAAESVRKHSCKARVHPCKKYIFGLSRSITAYICVPVRRPCETACFCLRSMILQATGDVGMAGLVSVCGPLRASWKGAHSPPWFDAACKEKRCVFMEALQTGRLYSKEPDVHAMLRRSKHAQTTPVVQSVWDKYLQAHFRPRKAAEDLAVPLGHGRDVEALLRQGTHNNWMPEPDAVAVPSEKEMKGQVDKQVGKMNGRASPGFDCVAAPFIKNATVVYPRVNGRGTEQVNVLGSDVARLFKLFYDKARIPA